MVEAGLGLWYSPAVFDYDRAETTRRTVAMAGHAEALRRRMGGQVTFVGGSEATLFVRGLVPGKRLTDRFAAHQGRPVAAPRRRPGPLPHRARCRTAPRFRRALTYASLSFEQPDWRSFDIVGVDHYRDDRVRDRYLEMLEPHLATGLPVVVSEVGRTYAGASASGALRFGSPTPPASCSTSCLGGSCGYATSPATSAMRQLRPRAGRNAQHPRGLRYRRLVPRLLLDAGHLL